MSTSAEPNLQPPNVVQLPSALDRLALRASKLPWWLIILLIGLVLALFGILTTPLYHEAFTYVTGNPQFKTTDFEAVTYSVNVNGKPQVISGMLVGQDSQAITVRTIDPVSTSVSKEHVANVQAQADGTSIISLSAQPVSGVFYTQTAGEYRVQLADGSILSVHKADVTAPLILTPAGCTPDIQGSCHVSLIVPSSQVQGKILGETADAYTVQTVAPQFVTVQRSDIVRVISEITGKGQCALNNIQSCQSGVFLTAFLTLLSFSIALVIGLLIALMRISPQPILKNLAILYVEVVRGIPILVILLIFGFVVAYWLQDNFHISLPNYVRGILGLSFAYGAYLAEVFRAGIQSISRGQMEAARSLGMTYFQAMRFVILPQAIRVVLPPLGNDFIAMLKDTSLVVILTLQDMTQLATLFQASKLRVYEPYLTIAVIYLVLTLMLSFLVRLLEYRMKLPT